MNHIIKWCIDNPVFVNLMMVLVVILGVFYVQSLNRELFPEFSLDRILIQVVFPGASPEEVEEGICIKIEESISGISGIKKIESTARESVGTVLVEIDEGKDIYRLKDEIESQINQINTFPVDAEKPIVKDLKLVRQVVFVTVSGDINEYSLRRITEEVKDELLQTDEISQATIVGLRKYEISIEFSEEMMRKFRVTAKEIGDAIRSNSLDLSGGILKTEQGEISLRVKGQKYIRKDFEDIVIRTNPNGAHLYLHQIAQVKDAFEETRVRGYLNGKRAALVNVYKTADEDMLRIADRVYKYIEEKQKRLPQGVHLGAIADTSKVVQSRLDLLKTNGLQGLVLVFLSLALFLSLRIACWVAWGIPMSFLMTFVLLLILGQSLNMLSMFALIMALGMIVDDAIVISESIHTHLYQQGLPPREAAYRGTVRVFWPVVGSISTTVASFLPLFAVTGIMGKFIAVIPITVVSALLCSLVEGLVMLPCHLAQTLPRHEENKSSWGYMIRKKIDDSVEVFIGWYSRLAKLACEYRYATLGLGLSILFVCLGLIQGGFVKLNVFPKLDSDFITVKLMYPEGTSEMVTERTILHIEKKLWQLNEILKKEFQKKENVVLKVYTVVGEQSGESQSSGANLAEINVELLALEQRNIPSELILNRWRALSGEIPGVSSLRFTSMGGGPGGKPIQVELRGDDYNLMQRAAEELKQQLRQYSGVYDIDDDFKEGAREVRIDLKPEARQLGLSLYDLATQVRHGFYGNEVMRIQRGKFDVRVFVRYPQEERTYLSDVGRIKIRTSANQEIPITEVANMRLTMGYSTIRRIDNKRIMNVVADLDETKTNAYEINDDLMKSGFLDRLCLRYPGVSYAFEGQRKETNESLGGLKIGFVIALIGIYTILATIFSSYVQPIIIMIAIPFGLVGAVLGHLQMGYPLTMMSLFGLVALSGIVVNNSLLIIDFINESLSQGVSLIDSVVNAGCKRFRPILLTTVTTILGVSTLLFGGSMQAQYLIPMAISLAFGLMFSTLLTLLIVPASFVALTDVLRFGYWILFGRWVDAHELYGIKKKDAESVQN